MDPLESAHINCPYCGEPLEITVDASAGRQDYIEDCQVGCQPIQFRIRVSAEGGPRTLTRAVRTINAGKRPYTQEVGWDE